MALVIHEPAKAPISFISAERLHAAPPVWQIATVLPQGMLAILSGKDKLGKTLLAWSMVQSVTSGTSWLDKYAVKQAPVLFLALDDPAVITVSRIADLGLKRAPLHVATPLQAEPHDPRFWPTVQEIAKETSAGLIVVDALYLFLQGGHDVMNTAGGMSGIMRALNYLAEVLNMTVLLITHDRKDGGDVAGSFVVRAAAKQIMRLQSNPEHADRRILTIESKLVQKQTLHLRIGERGIFSLVQKEGQETLTKGEEKQKAETVRGLLAKHPDLSPLQVFELERSTLNQVRISLASFYRLVKRVHGESQAHD